MNRKTIVRVVLVVALVGLSGPDRAEDSDTVEPEAPQLAPALLTEPQRVESFGAEFPSRVPADEAERLFLRMGLAPDRHSTTGTTRTVSAPANLTAVSGGVSRTIELVVPPVVNRTDRFVFRDVTLRQGRPHRQQITIEERRKAVEAYRLSLIRSKSKGASTP